MREGSRREKQRKKKGKKECGGVREKLSPTSHGLIRWGLPFLIYLQKCLTNFNILTKMSLNNVI